LKRETPVNDADGGPVQRSISRNEPMTLEPKKLIYTILADDAPVVVLEASGAEARELCKEKWFLEELSVMKIMGEPLYKPGVRLRTRPATEDEWLTYDHETEAADDAEDMLLVYLVHIDRS
jgi:hypothetical protein